jgi:hypothetical protein
MDTLAALADGVGGNYRRANFDRVAMSVGFFESFWLTLSVYPHRPPRCCSLNSCSLRDTLRSHLKAEAAPKYYFLQCFGSVTFWYGSGFVKIGKGFGYGSKKPTKVMDPDLEYCYLKNLITK